MSTAHPIAPDYRRDLGDGLVLRWSTAADTENIAQLCSMVFRDKEDDPPNDWMHGFVHSLMSGENPHMGQNDFGVVEDTRKEGNPLVACTCLMRHTWYYDSVTFPVGRPEIVAADPAYRKRGLIRALFGMVHGRSEAEGHLVHGITGIAHFYRQFGYEYVLDLEGERTLYLPLIPKLKEGETEPYTLRELIVEDIPLLLDIYNARRTSSLVSDKVTETLLLSFFKSLHNLRVPDKWPQYQLIQDTSGNPKGFLVCRAKRWWRGLNVFALEFVQGANIQAIMPSVLRWLHAYGLQMATGKKDTEPLGEIHFNLGGEHPVYDALGNLLVTPSTPPYPWYIRVPDLPAFLQHIAPVLEKRLAGSIAAGYTGEIKIDFYRDAIRMVFADGKLTTVVPWQKPIYSPDAGVGFPPLVFLKLLFCYRSLDDLRQNYADVWANNDTAQLLNILFPKQHSRVFMFAL